MPQTDFKSVLARLGLILRSVSLLRKVHAYVLFKINKRTREKGLCVLDLSQPMFQLKNAINTREGQVPEIIAPSSPIKKQRHKRKE